MTPQEGQALNALAGTMAIGILLGMMLLILWLFNLIDVIRSDFKNPSDKTMWILLLLFIAPLAAIIYPIISGKQKAKAFSNVREINNSLRERDNAEKKDWF